MEPVVVVDGSNVIHANAGTRKYFSVARVKNVIGKLSKLGYTYKIGMKGKTYNYILYHAEEDEINEEDKSTLEKLVNDLEVSLLDAEQDDQVGFILQPLNLMDTSCPMTNFAMRLNSGKKKAVMTSGKKSKTARRTAIFRRHYIFDLPPVVGEESDVHSPLDAERVSKPVAPESSPEESGEDVDVWGSRSQKKRTKKRSKRRSLNQKYT